MDSKNAVLQVKAAYDVADYLRTSGLSLTPAGVGKWKACCPFHTEKTPSFTINENFQNYHCFGCGVSGDLLSYVMHMENLSFSEALTKLADDKGIVIDFKKSENDIDYDSLQKILKISANFYCKNFDALPEDHVAKKEITERGLSYDNSKPDFIKYGYSPEGNKLTKLLLDSGFSEELIIQSGMCRKHEESGRLYDFFRSRLMFVFTDRYGKPIGFSSRKIYEEDNRGKYVNSSESPLFHKSKVLYNHTIARKSAGKEKVLYIAEGQFDVAALVSAGVGNSVAASGTAFTRDHVVECKRLVGQNGKLVFCFDGDSAGLKAATRVFMSFPEVHEDGYVIAFPDGDDPCDYRLKHGDEALIEYISNPMTMVEFILKNTKDRYDFDTVLGRSNYIEECASVIKGISNNSLKESCMRIVSLESVTPIDTVREAVRVAKPLKFSTDGEREKLPVDRSVRPVDSEELTEDSEDLTEAALDRERLVRFEKFKTLVECEEYYALCAKFVSLGLARKAWRASVVRSKNLLPKSLHGFIDDLENNSESEVLFAEMFKDEELARYLMNDELSPFYKFMELVELKDHFIYLHGRLQELVTQNRSAAQDRKIQQMLLSDESGSLEYYKSLLETLN